MARFQKQFFQVCLNMSKYFSHIWTCHCRWIITMTVCESVPGSWCCACWLTIISCSSSSSCSTRSTPIFHQSDAFMDIFFSNYRSLNCWKEVPGGTHSKQPDNQAGCKQTLFSKKDNYHLFIHCLFTGLFTGQLSDSNLTYFMYSRAIFSVQWGPIIVCWKWL